MIYFVWTGNSLIGIINWSLLKLETWHLVIGIWETCETLTIPRLFHSNSFNYCRPGSNFRTDFSRKRSINNWRVYCWSSTIVSVIYTFIFYTHTLAVLRSIPYRILRRWMTCGPWLELKYVHVKISSRACKFRYASLFPRIRSVHEIYGFDCYCADTAWLQ